MSIFLFFLLFFKRSSFPLGLLLFVICKFSVKLTFLKTNHQFFCEIKSPQFFPAEPDVSCQSVGSVEPKLHFDGCCSLLVLPLKIIELPLFCLWRCYGSPSSPSMVRTRTYSSASPTTDAAITADITLAAVSVNRY